MRNKNFLEACKNAIAGVIYSIKTQWNVRMQIIMIIGSIIAGVFFELEKVEFMILMFSVILNSDLSLQMRHTARFL